MSSASFGCKLAGQQRYFDSDLLILDSFTLDLQLQKQQLALFDFTRRVLYQFACLTCFSLLGRDHAIRIVKSFYLKQLCPFFGYGASLHHFWFLFVGIWAHLTNGGPLFANDGSFRENFDWLYHVEIC